MEGKVRFGVLGAARVFERRMIPAFAQASNATLVALASRSEEKAQAVAGKYGIAKAFAPYEALLTDPEIDAVFIPLPNDLHARWTLAALEAGKHVLCDKPLALSFDDARACASLAREKNLRLMEGFMYRHHPQHAFIAETLKSGALGELQRVEATFSYPAARDLTNIRYQQERGGGALTDVGVYGINAARWYLGEPQQVFAVGQWDPECGVDTSVSMLLRFAQGKCATISASFSEAFASTYSLIGTEGTLVAERAFQVGEKGTRVRLRAHNSDEWQETTFPHIDQYRLEIEHFAGCVSDPGLALAPGEDGVAQARAVELLREALAHSNRP